MELPSNCPESALSEKMTYTPSAAKQEADIVRIRSRDPRRIALAAAIVMGSTPIKTAAVAALM